LELRGLLETESILAYKMNIPPSELAILEYSEVLFLENKLRDYLEKETEAYSG